MLAWTAVVATGPRKTRCIHQDLQVHTKVLWHKRAHLTRPDLSQACAGADSSVRRQSRRTATQIVGIWSGTLESDNYLPIAAFMDLRQAGTRVDGTWAASGGPRIEGNITGQIEGSNFSGNITFSIQNAPPCSGSFSGSVSGAAFRWNSSGFTGPCSLNNGNPLGPRFVMQRR